ncbi:MAG: helix-turn-helix domain-containing protein [Nocardioides sp.]
MHRDDPPAGSTGVTVAEVLQDAGHTLLNEAFDGQNTAAVVDGLVIHDTADVAPWPSRPFVLAVGVRSPDELRALRAQIAGRASGAVVVREDVVAAHPNGTADLDDPGSHAVPVLTLRPETSWMQVAATVAPMISGRVLTQSPGPQLGGVPSGDLFALANAIAEVLDAPVTVEDRDSRVLAFSIRQEEADPSRIAAILNRQVTPWATQELQGRGIFRDLYRTDEPLFVEPPESGHEGYTMPRVVLGIRAGDEILGSVWAAVSEPLAPKKMQAFGDLQDSVAVHMLSHRANANVERRLRSDLMSQALGGGPAAAEVAARLGLPRRPMVVLALALPDEDAASRSPSDRAAELQRVADALDMYLGSSQPGASAALVGDVVYGVVPLASGIDDGSERVRRMARDFLTRVGRRSAAVVGVGSVAGEPPGLARSKEDSDRALRLARTTQVGDRVCSTTEHAFELLMMEMADLVSERGLTLSPPFARLVEHDEEHGSELVETLRAWLDHFGDNTTAAEALHVHPNTFRYRLKRASEVSGLDLADRDVRLSLMLQLRLVLRD